MDISRITDYLYVGGQPKARHAEQLTALGVRLVISMRGESRPPQAFQQPPLSTVWLRTYDTFFTPISVAVLLDGVRAALPVIERGEGVLVHCRHGKHRSVALAAAILIAQGYPAEEAMRLLRDRRAAADPQAWYIRRQIEKFEREWMSRGARSEERKA